MKTLFLLTLAGSLIANVCLWWRSGAEHATRSRETETMHAHSTKPPATGDGRVAKAVAATDAAGVRDALRAAGADDATVRAVVTGVLRRRYEEAAAAWRIDRARSAWWRRDSATTGDTSAPSARTMVQDAVRDLLGPDPLALVDAELRYEFLSPEKRRLLALIDVDYSDLVKATPTQSRASPTKSDVDEQNLIMRERQKDILAALTPTERAEYEFRFSDATTSNFQRFSVMGATEQELRTIQPLITAYSEQLKTLSNTNANYLQQRAEVEQRTMDQVVATIGYERALDYLWSFASGPYVPTVRLMREMDLPTARAAQLFQLAAETGAKGAAVHYDTTLSPEQKRAALAALQSTVRPQLDALVPAAVQAKLPSEAIAWFGALGDGRYAVFRPSASSNGWYTATPQSIATSPPARRQTFVLPRPAGN